MRCGGMRCDAGECKKDMDDTTWSSDVPSIRRCDVTIPPDHLGFPRIDVFGLRGSNGGSGSRRSVTSFVSTSTIIHASNIEYDLQYSSLEGDALLFPMNAADCAFGYASASDITLSFYASQHNNPLTRIPLSNSQPNLQPQPSTSASFSTSSAAMTITIPIA